MPLPERGNLQIAEEAERDADAQTAGRKVIRKRLEELLDEGIPPMAIVASMGRLDAASTTAIQDFLLKGAQLPRQVRKDTNDLWQRVARYVEGYSDEQLQFIQNLARALGLVVNFGITPAN